MDTFEQFWANAIAYDYPRRVKKLDSRKAWKKLAPDEALVRVIFAAHYAQAQDRIRKIMRCEWVPEMPYVASWIRSRRWEDDIPQPRMTMASAEDLKKFKADMERKREAMAKIAPATSGLDVLP